MRRLIVSAYLRKRAPQVLASGATTALFLFTDTVSMAAAKLVELPPSTSAQTQVQPATTVADAPVSGLAGSIATTLIALIVVLALAWLALRLLKRVQQGKPGEDGELKFVRSLPLGPKERVVLIAHRDKEYLLGVTAAGISLIARLEDDASPAIRSLPQVGLQAGKEEPKLSGSPAADPS
jgi:flagellar protein FliO/FliZ